MDAQRRLMEQYHNDGFIRIPTEDYGFNAQLKTSLRRNTTEEKLSNNDCWVRNPKDQGTLTLKHPLVQENLEAYIDLLVGSGLHALLERITGRSLFLTNLMHLVTDQRCGTLRWHRDSYLRKGTWVGPLPPPMKCAVYLSGAGPKSSVTGFIRGSHRFDPKNMYVDLLAAYTLLPYQVFQAVGEGDAVIFDGSILHCRRKPKAGSTREAIIFGLTAHPNGQKPYMADHHLVIDAFMEATALCKSSS